MTLAGYLVLLAVVVIAPHLKVGHAIGYCLVLLIAAGIAKWFGL